MAFDDFAVIPGRKPATIVELDLDSCTRTYGFSPCTATLARTNIVRESQTFDVGATWAPFNAAVTANAFPAPDGTSTADRLNPDDFVTNEVKELLQPLNLTLLNTTDLFCASVYVRVDEGAGGLGGTDFRLKIRDNSVDGAFVDITTTNGQIINRGNLDAGVAAPFVSARCEKAFGFIDSPAILRDWWRVELVFQFGTVTVPTIRCCLLERGTGNASFVGTVGEGVYLWGAQMRPGSAAGIYAPTTTTIIDGMGTADDICFNTFGTCQDTPNYQKEVKTYSLTDTLETPIDLSYAFPCIKPQGVKYTPTRLQPGGDISLRGKVTIRCQDFTHNDGGGPTVPSALGDVVDKYFRLRTYDPESQGTFFGKLKARNEFYVGRPMRVLEGYLDEPFSISNFRTREYIIEEIRGPSADGSVEIVGKDVLSLAINSRAKAPTPSVGTVADNPLTAGATTLNVSAGDGPDYDIDVHVRVDDEIMRITGRTADALTVTRGQGGTTAAEHSLGAAVQSCLTYEDEPVIDVIQNLLEDFASVPSSFIPFTDWEAEETASLSGYDMETIISEPTGVTTLLKEIMEITLIDLWYSDVDQEIKLKLETPFTSVVGLIDDDAEILENSLRAKDEQQRRLSRVLIWYGMRNFAEDLSEPSNFSLANFEIEADKELPNKFNDERTKVIFSRWFDSTNTTQVQLTSQRLLARFGRVPIELTFDVDAKDVNTFDVGDVVDIQSRIVQDTLGNKKTDRFQIIESQPRFPASIYTYKALAFFVDPISQGPIVISANQTDLDLFVELGGPPGPVEVTVTINAAVIIDATQGNCAVTTGDLHPDSVITLVNNGEIRGHAGNGGNGASAISNCLFEGELPPPSLIYYFFTSNGFGGSKGGCAIEILIDNFFIDNTSGNIFAGGGGGGGGGGSAGSISANGGGGGGGGRGSDGVGSAGNGGNAQTFVDFACPPITENDGSAGTDGSAAAAGTGGAGGNPGFTDGGDGGDWGDPGTVGDTFGGSNGGSAGAGGDAVQTNGATLTWLGGFNGTQVKGGVV